MSSEAGHAPSRVYLDQSGNLHLNGAALFDNNENNLSPAPNVSGLALPLLAMSGPLRLNNGVAVAAAGSAQGNAANLTTGFNPVTGADNTKGVILPVPGTSEIVLVKNTVSNKTLAVYPNLGSSIDGGSANAAVTQGTGKMRIYAADNTGARGGRWKDELVSVTLVQPLNLPPAGVIGAIGPQASTSGTVVVAGAEIDATQFKTVCYTAIAATHDVDWSVFGANVSDYSDEVAVLTATKIAAGANGSYTASPAPYRYYRVKVIDDVGGTHGTIAVNGIAK